MPVPGRKRDEDMQKLTKQMTQLASLQWIVKWYGMGKTSVESRFNIPGRIAWMTMESPGFLTLLYIMNTMPVQHGVTDLPWQNRVLGGLFVSFVAAVASQHTQK